MSSIATFVGLDYHQDGVQVCILDSEGKQLVNRMVRNSATTISSLVRRHGIPERVAIEACCGAANLAEELITKHQFPVQLAHPGYVARLKRSPDKTDLGDAQLLADLVRVKYLPAVWLAPDWIRQLRRLVRHRAQLVHRRTEVKLRIRALLRENRLRPEDVKPWTKGWLKWVHTTTELADSDRYLLDDHLAELGSLTQRIERVNQLLKEQTADDPIVQKLLALPGVGMVTAVTLRAEVGHFDRFNTGKELARFCGVTPRNASSGARQATAGLIRAGNPMLRKVLIEMGQRILRMQKHPLASLGARLLKRGKPRNVVVAAVTNRWMRWLHHELRREVPASTSAPAQQQGVAPPAFAAASASVG